MQKTRELKVALLVITGLVLFITGYSFLKGNSLFDGRMKLYAVYKNVESLKVGTAVTVSGLQVGQISTIDFVENSTDVLVSFLVRDDLNFSKNSFAELYEASLVGGKSIRLLPVYDRKPSFVDGDTLQAKVKLGLTDALEENLEPLQRKVESVMEEADSLLVGMNAILDKKGQENISIALEELTATTKRINSIAENMDELIGSQKKNLVKTLENTARITENINRISDSLSKTNLKQIVDNVEKISQNMNGILDGLNNGEGSMGRLLKNDSLYVNLEAGTKEIELLLRNIREHPKRYVHFSLFGKKEKSDKK